MTDGRFGASCLSRWFPIVKAAGLPVPKTVMVKAPDLSSWLDLKRDGDPATGFESFFAQLAGAAKAVGGYPIFLRTGQGSGKHEWSRTCFVPDEQSLPGHAYAIFDWSHMVDMLGLPTDVWAVREMLKTEPAFYAFDGNMPVTRERRCFVRDGKVICRHPYWPAEAIARDRPPDRKNWRECLMELNSDRPGDDETLTTLAARVAAIMPGFWSVDFLHTKDRGWVLIDMAEGGVSFHWPECPNGRSR